MLADCERKKWSN